MTVLNVDHKFRPRSSNEQQIVKAIELGSQILSEILKVDINIRVERMAGWAGADAHHAGAWVHHRVITPFITVVKSRGHAATSI